MRNLAKYPITTSEIEDCCRTLAKQLSDKEIVGDMRPSLLEAAATIISRVDFVTYDLGISHDV